VKKLVIKPVAQQWRGESVAMAAAVIGNGGVKPVNSQA